MVLANRQRRSRRADPLACPDAVRHVLAELRSKLPAIIPANEKQAISLLRAVKHAARAPTRKSKRGRPSKWPEKDLSKVESAVRSILAREKPGTDLVSFVDYYLRILSYPSDVQDALRNGNINLFEAQQLSRLKAASGIGTEAQARTLRKGLLAAHVTGNLSGRRLQERVKAEIEESYTLPPKVQKKGKVDLGDLERVDTTHLFWDELHLIGAALREIRQEDVTEDLLQELLSAGEKMWRVIAKLRKISKKAKRQK
jgi:hypothetical protein